ncbi:hypothetical protein QQ045_006888 [Rhodiola kirilowii]
MESGPLDQKIQSAKSRNPSSLLQIDDTLLSEQNPHIGCFNGQRYRSQNHSDETVKQPHKLERKWSFWFDNQSRQTQGAAWGASLHQIYTFDTVEEFWCLYDQTFKPSKLPGNAEIHLFRAGVEPKWEDPECANGGKWSIPSNRKPTLETMWLETST